VLRRSDGTEKVAGARRVAGAIRDNREDSTMLGAIIVGIIAGWLAGKLVRGAGYGLIGDLLLGLIGGLVGGWIFGALGVAGPNGAIGAIIVATVGAVILVWISHIIREV
jgi:uncharacterized membrane protein YeaQ/YmgE (transglycosylase-associated protein family)